MGISLDHIFYQGLNTTLFCKVTMTSTNLTFVGHFLSQVRLKGYHVSSLVLWTAPRHKNSKCIINEFHDCNKNYIENYHFVDMGVVLT